MKRTSVKELIKTTPIGKEVVVKGWLRSQRKAKSFSFLVLTDGSCQSEVQIIADETLANYAEISALLTGSSIAVVGEVIESDRKSVV